MAQEFKDSGEERQQEVWSAQKHLINSRTNSQIRLKRWPKCKAAPYKKGFEKCYQLEVALKLC